MSSTQIAARVGVILLGLAAGGCEVCARSPLYPDQFALTVRTTNRSEIQGLNFGLTWKLRPRGCSDQDR